MSTQKTKRLVLGEGEVFGHKHVLTSTSGIEYVRLDETIKMTVEARGILTHDEHDRMVFQAGRLRSYHQVEFNPMDGTTNRVFD